MGFLENVRLEPHPTAVCQAVSQRYLPPGSSIVSIPSLSTVLFPSDKGHRCDNCHILDKSQDRPLQRCSGCASYWYCDRKCQLMQWKAHHRKICRVFNGFVTSPEYQALAHHERLDALLLSHLIAEFDPSTTAGEEDEHRSAFSIFRSLIPCPTRNISAPPTCPPTVAAARRVVDELYSRFGNNNFAIHSHLTSFAHGIFPLASKLFNHSCMPNAAAKYVLTPSGPVRMEVVALSAIAKDEEICIPYVDPALIESRQTIYRLSYGFECACVSCVALQKLGRRIPDAPSDPVEHAQLERRLREYVFPSGIVAIDSGSDTLRNIGTIPDTLHPILHELFIASVSEKFSRTSHEGPYAVALEAGVALLALYVLIYPPNYPQIGMHLLELAKTAWNAVVTGNREGENTLLTQARSFLVASEKILMILGPEGDSGGPLVEIHTLLDLLNGHDPRKRSGQADCQ